MIQFTLSQTDTPDTFELRCSSVGSDTASKPPQIVREEHLTCTLLALLRAAHMEVRNV
jgi:hypothetical protein